ncbi:DNA-3-methyladenine glycosylase 2 family protein [Amycolatopsis sp. K13G38]|uniref:DNA-3-methyladenine glycosylase II n=1 Tax=Amycolatopsis acididurans TaxID=2724524 RepID=A0ABX1JHW5_9PSEU|nr:DNA-3-methyladenine glycosylase 2 family protein [Amycolatopsis acididurans]
MDDAGAQVGDAADAPPAAGTRLSLRLPYREPFDVSGIFGFLGARAVPGVEWTANGTYGRTLRLPHGPATIELVPQDNHIRCEVQLSDVRDLGSAVARARRLLDLDADPQAVMRVLGSDPLLAPAVTAAPGIRVPGAVDGPELLLRAMLGQQVSVAAARTAAARLTAALGDAVPWTSTEDDAEVSSELPPDGTSQAADTAGRHALRLFPAPQAIAERGRDVLRGPKRRIEAICAAAEALASGQVDVHIGRDSDELRAELLELPGVGPWTADYVLMRVLGAPDVLLADDLVIRKGSSAVGITDLADHSQAWRPWRSYAGMYLWRSA